MIIQLSAFGEKQVSREIMRVGQYAGDATPVMRVLARYWLKELARNFDTAGRHASGGWAPLKPSTVADKRSKGLDPRILHATLRLRRSLTEVGAPDGIRIIAPHQAAVGTTVPYARYHQTGTRKMPRRRPLELNEAARKRSVKIVQRYIITGKLEAIS